ncbi:MAG: hypothetical protein CML20_08800 [Rheinheimera sp.]|uniref:hypothetical protein n=1 Tax=Arsukibacterium sp. UBA3155 TaxID=1946058 RepID=UPI000C8C492D|nr:hypothetical protein [Arsukibacterium sp. UBA3155]MAD74870.1 hypothetical protein [Rheinheimera sp.]|tara:strand:- start:106192 stop:106578 length:387 start_codon:yes stop_codon:yes gene_type:complete
MKKLIIAAMALALSSGVNAQQEAAAGGTGVAGIGGLTIASLTALGVSAAVAAAIISNNSGVTLPDEQEFELVCNEGDGAPVAGVCTNSSTTTATATATASVSGTVTNTNTITVVPVTVTYPAIVQPVG